MKAFIIADDPKERDIFKLALRYTGLEVDTSADLKSVMRNWMQRWAYLIIVARDDNTAILEDVTLVRETSQMPLLFVIDPVPEERLCAILQAGADLVLERPVSSRVLAGYAQVLVRRSEAVPTFVLPTLELDKIALDPATRTVIVVGQEPRQLTPLEFYLLYVLMTNREQVVPTEIIVERVWGHEGKGDRELVRGLVSRLRRKLEPHARQSRFIRTIPGVGYRFTLEDF